MDNMRYGIIGFGCAGYNGAVAIRSGDKNAQIDVYERTKNPPFNPMLSTYLAGEKLSEDEVFPFGSIDEIVERLNINVHQGVNVERVDPDDMSVLLEDGTKETFDKILIATGARALIPGFLKCEGNNVFLMRTLDEARKLREYLSSNKVSRAVVVGGSMVGIKVAELLWRRNIDVTMIDAASYIFPLAAYKEIAEEIQDKLEEKGLGILMDAKVSKITDEGVILADGSVIEADLVCLCIGTKTNLDLVANTEILNHEKINVNKGIVINTNGSSSCKGIYAAGDCCEGLNLQTGEPTIIGLWANASAQGKCAGRNIAGVETEYYGNILHNITHFFDMDFIGLGDPKIEGEKYTFTGDKFKVSVVKDKDSLKSINILGNYRISGIMKNHLTK